MLSHKSRLETLILAKTKDALGMGGARETWITPLLPRPSPARDAGTEPTGVRPMKEKCQWHFFRPAGLAMGEPEMCHGSGG